MADHHHHEVSGKKLFITIVLNIIITLSQIMGAIFSGSLALLSDAVHNLSDVLTLILAYWTNKISARPKTKEKTFGYKRAEILAALFNSSLLLGIAIFLIIEAISKLIHPQEVESYLVILLGGLSIVLNTISVFLVQEDAKDNMNMKAAYLHLLTDVMTSVAVVLGGVLMYYFNIFWIDPVITILIAFYLIKASYPLVFDSISILMQNVPPHIDVDKIRKSVETFEEVKDIHHLHIWQLNDQQIHLETHIDFNDNLTLDEVTKICTKISEHIKTQYQISHITLQPEFEKSNCKKGL